MMAAMRLESELIPYAPARLEGSPVLTLAPHPDDEVFGCGAVLVQAARAGAVVRTVVLTDGGAQGDPETRYGESRAAAADLGLPAPDFWGLPDRSLDPGDEALRRRLAGLLREVRPAVVLTPSTAELNPDHRALAYALHRVLHEPDLGCEPAVVCYEVSGFLRPNLLVDVTAEWPEVLAAARRFGTQNEILPYLEVMDAVATARRLTLPPHVKRAAALHLTPAAALRTLSLTAWAAGQGPTAGLERDLPTLARPSA